MIIGFNTQKDKTPTRSNSFSLKGSPVQRIQRYGVESVPKIEIFYEGEIFRDIPVTVNLVRQKFWSRTKIFRKYWSARTKISWKKLSESGINGP